MLTLMNKRLQQFLNAENISQSEFADKIKVARASVSHVLSGRNKPGWDFINSMLENYPNLSAEWLLTGNGRMYKSSLFPEQAPVAKAAETEPEDLFSSANVVETVNETAAKPVQTSQESPIRVQETVNVRNIQATERPDSPFVPLQVIDNQRKISKIVVFYDDNTFIEIK